MNAIKHKAGGDRLNKTICLLVLLVFIVSLLTPPALAAALPLQEKSTVETVKVNIESGAIPSTRVVRRMTESVKTIGEHLLLGRSIIEVQQRKEQYERLVREVFDRVLFGYTVEKVEIIADAVVEIKIGLIPWGDIVKTVTIKVDYSGIAPEAIELVKMDMGKLEVEMQQALLGLPVEAVDWASGVARELIRDLLQRQLPEFHFSLDINAGQSTQVRLSLFPTGEIVREAKISLRSTTLPNLMLVHARPAIETQVRSMRGLPVAYIERRLSYFTEKIRLTTLADPLVNTYGHKVTPLIRPGTDTDVSIAVEAEKYRINAEVWLDVGKERDNISGKAHIGRKFSDRDELFLELKVMPGTMKWEFMPGWGRQFAAETWLGACYRINDSEVGFWLDQGLGGRWSLRGERWAGRNKNEVGIRYKLHDFLSAEFVLTNDASWLRLVGHL
jgi:hypothetical protein